MALTLANLKVHVTHALGGGDPAVIVTDAATTKRQIINEAGRLFCAEDWNFLIRPPATLNFTSGVEYVALPSDFAQMVGYTTKTGTLTTLKMTTPHNLIALRQGLSGGASSLYYAAIMWPTQTAANAAPPVPRLELWPTPSSSVTAALTITYRAGWTELSSDTDIPNIPTWAESLLVSFVRAYAIGYEEDSKQEEIAKVLGGPEFAACKSRDADVFQDFGPINGGAIQSGCSPMWWASSVPNP